MATTISSTGVSSGIDWNSLISAILQQEGQPVQRLQDQQTANTNRLTALKTLQTNMTALSSSLATLGGTSFNARSVTSTDTNNTYVTATATGAAVGSYDLQVSQVATKGRISPTLLGGAPTNLAVADPLATPVFTGAAATFALKGTDGVIRTVSLGSTNNNLYALRDAINALGTPDPNVAGSMGLGVTASVVNTGSGTRPYQLVLTAKDTGTGITNGVVRIADVTSGGAVNTLGIAAGTVDNPTAPTILSGGLASAGSDVAKDALFTVNGVQLTRKTNAVTDAVDGVTFTLKQGGQTGTTTLSVGIDKTTITTAMQDVVSKFNTLVTGYKSASASGGALANDSSTRSFITQIRAALSGVPAGLSSGAAFNSSAGLGIKTNQDGTLSLDTTAFQAALDKDPAAAKNIFANSGVSTSAAVSFYGAGTKTATGPIDFNITSFTSGGAISGNFTVGGTSYTLSGSNGSLLGTAGTPLEGLILNVNGTGQGTLTVSRGVGQAAQDVVSGLTAYGSGMLSTIMNSINSQNYNLTSQITAGQARLDRRKTVLQTQFAQVESTLGQLQAMGQSLSGMA
jgi:flagellar hook-associated protein 2